MTTGQTPPAKEDHVICSKAPEQLLCVVVRLFSHQLLLLDGAGWIETAGWFWMLCINK